GGHFRAGDGLCVCRAAGRKLVVAWYIGQVPGPHADTQFRKRAGAGRWVERADLFRGLHPELLVRLVARRRRSDYLLPSRISRASEAPQRSALRFAVVELAAYASHHLVLEQPRTLLRRRSCARNPGAWQPRDLVGSAGIGSTGSVQSNR